MNSSVKVELFQTLVKTFGGECPLSSVIDIGKDRELCNIIASDDNPWFKIDGKQVSVCLPGLEICSKYSNGNPCNGNCKTLHLCKNHLLGDCNKGAKCKLFHRLKNDHNNSIFSRFHSEGLQEDEILLYLKQKLQQDEKCDSPSKKKNRKSRSRSRKKKSKTLTVTSEICIEGNKREDPTVEETVNNGDANILQESVVEPTAPKDEGGKNNDDVISTVDEDYRATEDLVEIQRLRNFNTEVALPSITDTRTRGDITDPMFLDETEVPNYQGIKNETKEPNHTVPMISKNASSFTRNPIADLSKPRQTIHRLAALRFLLQQEEGICLLSEFAEGTGFTDSSAALQWIQSPDGRRVCKFFETRGQSDPLVVTSVLHLDLCPGYLTNNGCTDILCPYIHICKEFLEGNCLRQFCQNSHSITHFRNIKAFSLSGVDLLNGPEILQVMKFCLPQVCKSYNSEQGCNNLDCTKFHVCVEFVKGRCFLGRDNCNYEHTMSSFFNRKLSTFYGKDEDVLLSILTASWHQELTIIPVVDKISMLPMILGIKKHSTQTGKTSKMAVPRNMNSQKVSPPNLSSVEDKINETQLAPYPSSVPALEQTIPQSTNPWQEGTSQFYSHVPKTKCAEDSNSSVKSQGVVPSFTFGDFDDFDANLATMEESITQGTPYHDGQVKVGKGLESQSPFSFSHINESVTQLSEHRVSIKTPNLTYAGIVGKRKEEEQCTGASLKSNTALISAKRRARTGKTLQKEILNCLLQSPDGCYTLADLHRQLQNDFHTTVDLLTWLNGPMGKKMCVIQNAVTPHDTIVILRISKFQLCFDYMSKSGCAVTKCIFLHLCRRYVSDACEDDRCKFSHDTMSTHNRQIVKNCGLTFDSNEDIRKAVTYSQPRVCENYNSTKGCQNAACNRFHICANYVQKICPFENCKKGHHLQTPRNIRLLSTLGFEERLGFKMMLVTCSTESAKIQSQLGSSYASGLNTIGTVSRLELLLCLLNHNQAHMPLEELTTLEIFKDISPADVLTWLKSAEGREICKVFPTNYQGKHVVSLGIKSLQLCFGYCLPCGCQKEDCKFLHICREYIAEFCTRTICKYSHDIRNDHNRSILKKAGVESLTDQNLVKAIRLSVPKVCMEYNSRMGCTQNVCTKFHVCADKVRHRCDSEKTCPKNHSLSSSHNRELLQMYDSTENTMHMMLLVTNEHASKLLDRNLDRLEHICIEEFLPQVLRDHNGYCSIKQFLASFPVVLTNSEALDLLNKTKVQKYFIAFQHSGEMMVVAKGRLNLCFGYQGLEGCHNENCSYLHLCKDLLLGSCTRLKQCKLSHSIKNKYNAKILQGVGIAKNIANDLVLTFIRNSIPTVCPAHNTDEGCPSKLCRAFHICSNYVKQLCPKIAERCCFGHSFKTTHNQELLELYQSNRVLIKGRIIVADNME